MLISSVCRIFPEKMPQPIVCYKKPTPSAYFKSNPGHKCRCCRGSNPAVFMTWLSRLPLSDQVRFKAIWFIPTCDVKPVWNRSATPTKKSSRYCHARWEYPFFRSRSSDWPWWPLASQEVRRMPYDVLSVTGEKTASCSLLNKNSKWV